ncbi:MAG: hypothetical protein M0Z77_08800 [Thermoplasmatales archaeon]|nr:hypothetical protein [Thermoplasmatales archaeon]
MVRFITKKDKRGRNKHIPIKERGGNTGVNALSLAGLKIRPEREDNKLTGDTEYIGYGQTPGLTLEPVRRHVINEELSGTPLNEIKEEWYYYNPQGKYRTYRQFMEKGGDFDYIARGPKGRKYMVNAGVEKKGSHWSLSGIGNWMSSSETEEKQGNQEKSEMRK